MIIANLAGVFPIDSLLAEVEQLGKLATIVMNQHTNERGRCTVCTEMAFPCSSVDLATHSVALNW